MTGIIVAMSIEAEKILANMTEKDEITVSGVTYTKGNIDGKSVVLAVCGIGKVFAAICAEAMILNFKVDRIINSGVAGSLSYELDIADMVIASSAVQHDMDTSPLGDPRGLISGINKVNLPCDGEMVEKILGYTEKMGIKALSGVIATGDVFVHLAAQKKDIAKEFGAVACEMEGGAIAQVCYVNNIPCNLVRCISDSLNGGSLDYERFKYIAADRCSEVILKVVAGE